MISPNLNNICEHAKLYYYDFINQIDSIDIPGHFLTHIKQCNHCQSQINQLKTALKQSEKTRPFVQKKSGTLIANTLKEHFSYVNKDTNCSIVKPFLPGMLNDSSQINIPTPITAHLDNCPECVRDLQKISDLCLDNTNLSVLSSLLDDKKHKENISCSQAKSGIMAFVMMAFNELDEEMIKHLCTCKKCSDAIFKYRESIRNELMIENKAKPCFLSSKLSYNDIFSLIIPYGLDTGNYKQSESMQSRISHIRRCPFCLEKAQELHHIISDIQVRPDSETVTKYSIGESIETAETENSENIYEGFPVHVEVSGANEKEAAMSSASTINFTSALKNNIISRKSKLLYRSGFAGAFLIAAMLTFMYVFPSNVEALSMANICNSYEKEKNVHVISYNARRNERMQEQWISRSYKMKIFKMGDELALWDIKGKSLTEKILNSKSSETRIMPKDWLSDAEKNINSSQGMVPYYSISDIPPNAKWSKIDDYTQPINYNGETEAYDLTYLYEVFDLSSFVKLRFIVKADTKLPVRIEFYRKRSEESEYEFSSYNTIDYLSNEDFISQKKSYFN